jgi:hypothetical protein
VGGWGFPKGNEDSGEKIGRVRIYHRVKDIWGSKSVAWSSWTLEGGRERKAR